MPKSFFLQAGDEYGDATIEVGSLAARVTTGCQDGRGNVHHETLRGKMGTMLGHILQPEQSSKRDDLKKSLAVANGWSLMTVFGGG